MIPVAEPLHAIRGKCPVCFTRCYQVLLENTIEGKYTRLWLKVDAVQSAGDEGDGICGYSEHRCATEAA